MGRNGSGKSTMLKIISGVYPADAGTVEVDGRLAPALELGVGFSPELSAAENAAITGVMLGLSRREARRKVSSILDFADLSEFSQARLKDLSHGMRMRLAFAALIETDPDVLLVDEILAVGDRAFQEKCTEAFAAFRKRGRTIVLVSHATGLIERLCDRALLLEQGRVEALGDPGRGRGAIHRGQRSGGRSEAEMIDDGDERRGAVLISDAWLSVAAGPSDSDRAPSARSRSRRRSRRSGPSSARPADRDSQRARRAGLPLADDPARDAGPGRTAAGPGLGREPAPSRRVHAQPLGRQAGEAGKRRSGLAGRADCAADPGRFPRRRRERWRCATGRPSSGIAERSGVAAG